MRLGSQRCPVKAGTLAYEIYGPEVNERHRHRCMKSTMFTYRGSKSGLVISARTPNESLPEMMELPSTNSAPLVLWRAVPSRVHFDPA